jgi:hypothetical protein
VIFGRIKNPQTIIFVGMLFMALAGISNFWFRHHSPVSENAGDGIMGFLYGVAIGTLLIGIWRRGRQRRESHGGCV